MDKKVTGLKLYIGGMDLGDIKSTDFVNNITLRFNTEEDLGLIDSTGIYRGTNKLTCKYYDDESGYMYVTFDKEVDREDLPFFDEDEIIYKD